MSLLYSSGQIKAASLPQGRPSSALVSQHRQVTHEQFVRQHLAGLTYNSRDQDRFAAIVSHQLAEIRGELSTLAKQKHVESEDEDFELGIKDMKKLEELNAEISRSKKAKKILVAYMSIYIRRTALPITQVISCNPI